MILKLKIAKPHSAVTATAPRTGGGPKTPGNLRSSSLEDPGQSSDVFLEPHEGEGLRV